MKIKLNGIDFEVSAVEEPIRAAVLADPLIAKAVWRDVWRWDQAEGKGTPIGPVTDNGSIPLANGLCFFVAKSGTEPAPVKNDSASKTSGERFLKALNVKSTIEVLRAMTRLLGMPQKTLPKEFDPLKPVASFGVKMHVEHSVLRLRNASRNLQAYLLVPGQLAFHHEITAIGDEAGYEALVADKPELKSLQPRFLVPSRSKANREMRAIAQMERLRSLTAEAKAQDPVPEALRMQIGRTQAELRMLAQAAQQARAGGSQPRTTSRAAPRPANA